MPVIDQAGGNANAGITAGLSERPIKAYQWTCTNPGCPSPNQIGRIEDGCKACGAGKDAIPGSPLPPTDYNCQACRGTGTVERKCAACEATGMIEAPQLGEPPPSCEKCGGAGSVALGCGRCDGSGIDPEPASKAIPAAVLIEAGQQAMAADPPPIRLSSTVRTPELPEARAGIFKPGALPSIDEPMDLAQDRGTVVRYRLIRYEGPAEDVAQNIALSLDGCVSPGTVKLTGMEIAEPKAASIQERLKALEQAPPRWDVKDRKFRGDRG